MAIGAFIESTLTKSVTFTSSLVNTHEIDKYRQGVSYFSKDTHPHYLYDGVVKVIYVNTDKSAQSFPQDRYPRVAFIDETEDESEQYGFWYDGYIEPLTIRDEASFSSVESPFISRTFKAATFEHVDLIEQKETRNQYTNVNPNTFIESGSNIITTTTGVLFNSTTSSLISMIITQNSGDRKRSAAAGYDYVQVVLSQSLIDDANNGDRAATDMTSALKALYRDADSIAFRGRAPGQIRAQFLLNDSIHVNLSGTGFSFEKGHSATVSGNLTSNNVWLSAPMTGAYLGRDIKTPYPPISRLSTDFNGTRHHTFIDEPPSGTFPSYIRTRGAQQGAGSATKVKPASVFEHGREKVNFPAFREGYNDLTGALDLDTGEDSNIILKFHLKEESGKYALVSGRLDDIATASPLKKPNMIIDGVAARNKILVYDWEGSSETTGTAGSTRIMSGAGWWESGGNAVNPYHLLLPGNYQLAINTAGTTRAGVSLLTDSPKDLGIVGGFFAGYQWNSLKYFLSERKYTFTHPFVIKNISVVADILMANSGAVVPTLGAIQTGSHQWVNWTFEPLIGGVSTMGTKLSHTAAIPAEGLEGTQTRTKEVPHATFLIVKTMGSVEQTRGDAFDSSTDEDGTHRNVAGSSKYYRLPVGNSVYNAWNSPGIVVQQVIFSASFGLSSSAVSSDEQTNYPVFDARVTTAALSGTGLSTATYVTQSVSFTKKPVVEFNVTKSTGELDFYLKRDMTFLTSQTNLINKGESISFIWSPNTLQFNRTNNVDLGEYGLQSWAAVFGVRDMHLQMEGYIPRAGVAAPESLNQNLITEAVHESIHESIYDEFETYFSSAYTGSMMSRLLAQANAGSAFDGTLDFTLHGYKIFDSSERFFDTGLIAQTGSSGIKLKERFFPTVKVGPNSKIFNEVGGLGLIGDFDELNRTHVRQKFMKNFHVAQPAAGNWSGSVGFRYGIMSTSSIKSSVIFRNNRFGQFRDMLEQRLYGRFVGTQQRERTDEGVIIDTTAVMMSSSTKTLGQNPFLTSSNPWNDNPFVPTLTNSLGAPFK